MQTTQWPGGARDGAGRGKVDRERIRALLAEGLPVVDVAARLGISTRTVLRAKRELGLPLASYVRRTIGPEDLALIGRLLDEGWSYNEITATHRYTHGTLTKYFPGRGMDPLEASRLGLLVRNTNRAVAETRARARQASTANHHERLRAC